MKITKKQKAGLIVTAIVLIGMLIIGFTIISVWNEGNSIDKYGTRLDDIKKEKIKTTKLESISKKIKDNEIVKDVTVHIEGRIINFDITVIKGSDITTAKKLSSIVLENFSKKEKALYDMQIFLIEDNKDKESKYPYIGYKHKTVQEFKWSNN
ncbi:MAG: hypothetical protein RSB77_05665 [Bacilli bacterium]